MLAVSQGGAQEPASFRLPRGHLTHVGLGTTEVSWNPRSVGDFPLFSILLPPPDAAHPTEKLWLPESPSLYCDVWACLSRATQA